LVGLARVAHLSARSDTTANRAFVISAALTLAWASAWPKLIFSLAIFALIAEAARDVLAAVRCEGAGAELSA
jgi:Co/Zn/Cd efflux system component